MITIEVHAFVRSYSVGEGYHDQRVSAKICIPICKFGVEGLAFVVNAPAEMCKRCYESWNTGPTSVLLIILYYFRELERLPFTPFSQ